jgi:hypothetical protein
LGYDSSRSSVTIIIKSIAKPCLPPPSGGFLRREHISATNHTDTQSIVSIIIVDGNAALTSKKEGFGWTVNRALIDEKQEALKSRVIKKTLADGNHEALSDLLRTVMTHRMFGWGLTASAKCMLAVLKIYADNDPGSTYRDTIQTALESIAIDNPRIMNDPKIQDLITSTPQPPRCSVLNLFGSCCQQQA